MHKLVVALAVAAASHACGHGATTSTTTTSSMVGESQACDPMWPCGTGGNSDPMMALATVGALTFGLLGLVAFRRLFLGT